MEPNLAAAILMERLVRSAYASRHADNVHPLQWSILRYLAASNGDGQSLVAVAKYVGVTPGPASRAVQTLENKGLVSKRKNPSNARSTLILLTEEGRVMLGEDPLVRIASGLNNLPKSQNTDFLRSLRNLVLQLEKGVFRDEAENSSGRR